MKILNAIPSEDSSSAPTDFGFGSGNGSLMATIVSKGVVVSRYTPQGSIKPFGQDTGTADDNTVIATEGSSYCTAPLQSRLISAV
jgi:hypothetical protein